MQGFLPVTGNMIPSESQQWGLVRPGTEALAIVLIAKCSVDT